MIYGIPKHKGLLIPDSGKRARRGEDRERERERGDPQGRQGKGGCALRAERAGLGGKRRWGRRAGGDLPEQGRELSVGQEMGLAPVIPALMS